MFLSNNEEKFLKEVDSQISDVLRRLKQIRINYAEKVRLTKKFLSGFGKEEYRKMGSIIDTLREDVKKSAQFESQLSADYDELRKRVSSLQGAEKDRVARERLDNILVLLVQSQPKISSLNLNHRNQVQCFEDRKKWDDEIRMKKLLVLIYEEGELLGIKKAARKQTLALKRAVEDVELYKKITSRDFADVVTQEFNFEGIRGTIYASRRFQSYKRGVVATHGIFATKRAMHAISLKLAAVGYVVYAFTLPGHTKIKSEREAVGKLSYGLVSEQLIRCVQFMATADFQIVNGDEIGANETSSRKRKVAIVGWSLGAAGAVFASYGYDRHMEAMVYNFAKRDIELKEELIKAKEVGSAQMGNRIIAYLEENYRALKQLVLTSLKNSRFQHGEISAMVLLAPPETIQSIVPRPLMRFIGAAPNILLFFTDALVLDNKKELVQYLMNVKNPGDYLELVYHFSKRRLSKEQDEEISRRMKMKDKEARVDPVFDFMQAYRQRVINPIPKLLMYGTADLTLGTIIPFFGNRRAEKMMHTYSLAGNLTIKKLPGQGHFFNNVWVPIAQVILKSTKESKMVVKFLNENM